MRESNLSFNDYEPHVLDHIEEKLKALSEMSKTDRNFLNGIIRHYKPKKIVEIGVSYGASSAILLNATKDNEQSRVYSLDLSPIHYKDSTKKTGFLIEELFPEFLDRWILQTGGLACEFLDQIGDGIDLCLIDTTHRHPGEFLDYLMVLPYMKKDGIIVIHDTCFHTFPNFPPSGTCNILFSTIRGIKFSPTHWVEKYLPNIGAVQLEEKSFSDAWSIFNLLSLRWCYLITDQQIATMRRHFQKHYGAHEIFWFDQCCRYNLDEDKKDREQKELRLQKEKASQQLQIQPKKNLPKQKDSIGKKIASIVKSYLFFPYYTYKSYKILQKKQ